MKKPKFSKPVWAMVFIVVAVIAALPLLGLAHYTTTNPKFCLTCHGTGEAADVSQYSQVHPS